MAEDLTATPTPTIPVAAEPAAPAAGAAADDGSLKRPLDGSNADPSAKRQFVGGGMSDFPVDTFLTLLPQKPELLVMILPPLHRRPL